MAGPPTFFASVPLASPCRYTASGRLLERAMVGPPTSTWASSHIARQRSRPAQKINVSRMQNVETAISEDHLFSGLLELTYLSRNFLEGPYSCRHGSGT